MAENSFAEKFSNLRKEKMLSQKEMGEILGVSNKAVSKWETGESIPQMKTIIKISEYFKISPDELLTGTKYEKEKEENIREKEILNALKNENQKLKTDLYGAEKKNKNTAVISISVCALCLMTILLIVLSNFAENKSNINDSIKSLGKENTSVEILGETFVPANILEKTYYDDYYIDYNEKQAEFVDENGKRSDVFVYADSGDKYIVVKSSPDNYIYVNADSRLIPDKENLGYIDIDKYDRYGNLVDSKTIMTDGIDYFLSCYNEENIPENSQEITKLYLYDDCYTVYFDFMLDKNNLSDRAYVEAGKIFSDKNGNIYYYDYLTAQTYGLGGEIFEY